MTNPTTPEAPGLRRRAWQFIHNVFVHPAMEFMPDAWGDFLHDWTAKHAFPGELK